MDKACIRLRLAVFSVSRVRMRIPRSPLAAIGLLALAWGASAPLMAKPPEGWLLAFDEEFDGKQLDQSKWGTTMSFIGTRGPRFHNDSYLSYTLDENVVFSDGHLRLRTDRRTIAGTEPSGAFDYTQGLISTDGKFSFTYGYIEIRAKYPGGKGLWPCFWLMPQDQQWPPEFDIAEYYAGRRTMHFGMAHGTARDTLWDSAYDTSPALEGEWHTYALEWTAGHATWFVDGIRRNSVAAEYVPARPMFILLSNSVSSRFGPSGVPDEKTAFPNDLEVEYVRVYQPPLPITGVSPVSPPMAKPEPSPVAAGPTAGIVPVAAIIPGK
jgi:beta-glucanase (GH16 family)